MGNKQAPQTLRELLTECTENTGLVRTVDKLSADGSEFGSIPVSDMRNMLLAYADKNYKIEQHRYGKATIVSGLALMAALYSGNFTAAVVSGAAAMACLAWEAYKVSQSDLQFAMRRRLHGLITQTSNEEYIRTYQTVRSSSKKR